MKKSKRFLSWMTMLVLSSLFALESCSSSKKTVYRNDLAFNPPDYKEIKRAVDDNDGEFYYPELLRRFEAADTTLTREQAYCFYYGTATRSNYNPYSLNNYEEIREALSGDTIPEENWQRAARAIETQLQSNPTNLRFHFYKQLVYSRLYGHESQEYLDAVFQVRTLLSAIVASGDGRSKETAFHVISVTDEYGLMEVLCVSPKMQSLIHDEGQSYDLMELKENVYGLESLYFNITVCMEAMNQMFSH